MSYGFIYVWYDRKHKRYYVGCHWGSEDDGYICSSTWMRNSYNRRPKDFKRKIVSRVDKRELLLNEEYKWLSMIKDEELGSRYYNLSKRHFGHWSNDPNSRLSMSKKMSLTRKGKSSPNKGKTFSEEHRKKLSKSHLGQPGYWTGKKRPEAHKWLDRTGRPSWNKGKPHSEQHRANLKKAWEKRRINTIEKK